MHATESERLVDVTQTARRLHVSTDTVRRRIHDGSLPALRVGARGGIRIPASAVDRLLVPYRPPEAAVSSERTAAT